MIGSSRKVRSIFSNGKHWITQGMTGSSSSIVTPHPSIRLLTLATVTLLLRVVSMTDGAAFINSNSDPTPKTALITNDYSNSNPSLQPNVKIKFSSQSGTVQPYHNRNSQAQDEHSNGTINEAASDSTYYDEDYYYDDEFETYSDEDLENVAASDDLHSHYFVKTNSKQAEVALSSPSPEFSPKSPVPVTTPNENSAESSAEAPPSISDELEDNIGSESVAGHIAHGEISLLAHTSAVNNFITTDVPEPVLTTVKDTSTSIPGTPGIDYPIYEEVPFTGFDCQKQRYKGFFADLDAQCQAWHYCDFSDGHSAFLCPNGTLFSQVLLTCDWWFNVNCREAQQLYVLNERLYRYIKVPKPSFPEDFHGPQVDRWLLQQLQLGLLPKKRKLIIDKTVVSGSN